jgi:hypothetical protein
VPDFARVHVVGGFRRGPARRAFAGIMGLASRQDVARVVEMHDLFQAIEVSIMRFCRKLIRLVREAESRNASAS